MNEKLIVLICEIILASATTIALAIILLSTWYDLRMASMKKHLQRVSSDLIKSRQPFVTIVVYAHNHAQTIAECLDTIANSHYDNYRVVVANHGSTDKTAQFVKQYQKSHPKLPITLYTAKPRVRYDDVIQRAIKKATNSDLVMTLTGSSFITPNVLLDSATHFTANRRLTYLQLRQQIEADVSIQTLSLHFFSLSKNLVYKALSIVHLLPKSYSSISRYNPSSLSIKHSGLYASTVGYIQPTSVHSRQHVPSITIRIVTWLIIAGMVSYWLWTAATLKSNLLLTLSWIAVCIWLLAAIWSDNFTRLTKKIELSVSVPFMYFAFYAQSIGNFFIDLWRFIRTMPLHKFVRAFQAELYSTHY